jgi:amino acid transporter
VTFSRTFPRWALLAISLTAVRAFAAPVVEIPAGDMGAPVAPSFAGASIGAQTTALLWSGAGLPVLAAPVWNSLQAGDAASIHASVVLTQRLAAAPAYRAQLSAALAPLGNGPALAAKLEAVARAQAALAPERVEQARAAVAAAAPQAVAAPGPKAALSALHARLTALGPEEVSETAAELDQAFSGETREGGDASLPAVSAMGAPHAGAAPLSPSAGAHALAPVSAVPAPQTAESSAPAGKKLRLLDLVGLGINSIIGAGIFIKPALLAKQAGGASIFAFPITALLLIPVGLTFAEAATYFSGKSGGSYRYVRGAFPDAGAGAKAGEWAGFSVTWLAWIALIFGWAGVTSVIAINLSYFFPVLAGAWASKAVAASVIAIISYVNYRGVKEGAAVSNAFAAAKLLPMLLFIALGLPLLHAAAFGSVMPQSLSSLGGACFLTFFALQGFENIAVPAGEVHEPAKTVPRAIILSMVIASLVYTGIQLVAYGVTPHLAESAKPLVDGGQQIFGAIGAGVMALCAFFSTTGDSAAAALFGARFIKVLADDGHVPGSGLLAKTHPRFGTPHVAILLTALLTMAALFLPIDKLMDISSVAVAAQYIGTCLALPFLRRRRTAPAGAFRVPGGILFPVIGALVAAGLSYAGGFGSISIDLELLGLGLALKFIAGLFKPKPAAA